jgi:hypothetical protein
VAEIPSEIVLKRDRDLEGRDWHIWLRRGLFALLPLVTLLALLDLFGQRPTHQSTAAAAADLNVYAPERVRSGVLFQARFRITAKRELKKATLVLDPGWLESMSVNSIQPQPTNQGSDDGRMTLELGHVPAGQAYVLYIYFQVNPTNVGHRSQSVELLDGNERISVVDRSITIFP